MWLIVFVSYVCVTLYSSHSWSGRPAGWEACMLSLGLLARAAGAGTDAWRLPSCSTSTMHWPALGLVCGALGLVCGALGLVCGALGARPSVRLACGTHSTSTVHYFALGLVCAKHVHYPPCTSAYKKRRVWYFETQLLPQKNLTIAFWDVTILKQ